MEACVDVIVTFSGYYGRQFYPMDKGLTIAVKGGGYWIDISEGEDHDSRLEFRRWLHNRASKELSWSIVAGPAEGFSRIQPTIAPDTGQPWVITILKKARGDIPTPSLVERSYRTQSGQAEEARNSVLLAGPL